MPTNPALAHLQFLAGAWDMELSDGSFLPDREARVHGSVTFQWIEQGAALVMRMGDAETPTATWIHGRDDSGPDYHLLYADDRGVSRVYRMSLSDGAWRIWRHTPALAAQARRARAPMRPDRGVSSAHRARKNHCVLRKVIPCR